MGVTTLPIRVGIVVIPDAVLSTLSGVFDVLNSFTMLRGHAGIPERQPFRVELVGETAAPVPLASGVPLPVDTGAAAAPPADIVIVPSVVLPAAIWHKGRYPALTSWIAARHRAGATICSACSGVFLIAETGLLDGREATVHWPYARTFAASYPEVRVTPERVLVVSGTHEELVSSGASTSWHDLVLYLVARHAGPPAAQAVAKFFALQRHIDGLAPFIVFDPPTDHGDALVADAQAWLARHASVGAPIAQAASRAGLGERTFARRFRCATGYAPLAYVQRLRVEEAKRRLERTAAPVDEIGWRVGYEDAAAFRRLFKRIAGMPPGRYRRQFAVPSPDPAGR